MKLLIATRNKNKLREIRQIFDMPGLELLGADDVGGLPEVEEDAETFEGNAAKKARELAEASGLWALADDSGLEVDALGGAPGVWSARYAGDPADYEANNKKLMSELEGVSERCARFRCAVALSSPTLDVRIVEGRCEGRIVLTPRGEHGFGYDPLFVPFGHEQTFAEMDPGLKNRISHRADALRKAKQAWGGLIGDTP